MELRTHLAISPTLVGRVVAIGGGSATVRLDATADMAADDRGLVHGGFVFGLADYAAMLAVNDPNVVLGAAETRFTAPVRVGDVVVADARRLSVDRRRHVVEVTCAVGTCSTRRRAWPASLARNRRKSGRRSAAPCGARVRERRRPPW
jgi:acyl-coenzyme A thioesterase PaaI-like protein